MQRLFSLLAFIVLPTGVWAAGDPAQWRIAMLLDALDAPGISFIADGAAHDGAWAKDYLTRRMKAAGPEIATAVDFISKIATISPRTGKPYRIRMADGQEMAAGQWFIDKLADIEIGSARKQDSPAP